MKRKNPYVHAGLMFFLAACGILLFYDTLFGTRALLKIWRQFLSAVTPVLYGAFFAYLLAPVVNFFERTLFSPIVKDKRTSPPKLARAGSLALTWLTVGLLLYLFLSIILPQLYASVLQLVGSFESYYNTVAGWLESLLATYPDIETMVGDQLNDYYLDVTNWLKSHDVADLIERALSQAQTVMSAAAGGVLSVVNFFKNLLVGVIVSIYLLATKEGCAALGRKAVYSLCSQRHVRWIMRGIRRADSIFSGFVRGKLLDSLIIGVLCFIGCSVLKFPYTPLVSVFIGVTNIIPFFGPFLGAIPSAFLILLASPMKALYFLIFVLVLQQLDGNIIGPMILGDKTGLSGLWVITAILVGGSFFGVPGMFFGVPVCACLYCFVNFLIDVRLRKKNLPITLDSYKAKSRTSEDAAASPAAPPPQEKP